MNLPDEEAAKFVTPGWLKRVGDVPIDDVAAMVCEDPSVVSALIGALRHARKQLDAKVTGETSDGYHTFDQLYDHRITLFIALCSEVDARTPTGFVWRSKLHSDGTMFPGWFIMGIGREPGQQITYHLPIGRWSETDWLGHEDARAPEFDGHTDVEVLRRLKKIYDYVEPQQPTPALFASPEDDDVCF